MVEVKKEERSKNTFEMEVTIEEERVNETLDAIYRDLSYTTQVPGFRKGKAPRAMLRRHVSPEYVKDRLVNTLVPPVFREVMENESVEIIGEPSLEIVVAEEGQPLVFKSRYLIKPEVRLPDPESMEVNRYRIEIRDIDVEREIARIQEKFGNWIDKGEGSAEAGNLVQIALNGEVKGLIAGNPGEQGNSILSESVLGMKAGEEITVPIEVEGQNPIEQTVQVQRIHEMKLPELNQDFIKKFGNELETTEDFTRKIRDSLTKMAENLVENRFQREAVVAFCLKAELDIPEDLIEEETGNRFEAFRENLKKDGVTIERYGEITNTDQETMEKEFRKAALWSLKKLFVLREFAQHHEIDVSSEEVDAEIQKMAARHGKSEQEFRELLEKNDKIKELKNEIWGMKVTEAVSRQVNTAPEEITINLDQWKALDEPEEEMMV